MKKLLTLALCLICTIGMQAQTLQDVANSESLTWYGVDLTETHFLNFGAYVNDETVHKNLPRWTFDPFWGDNVKHWKKKYKKKEIVVNLASSGQRNKNADYTPHLGTEPFEMSKEDLQKIVSAYETDASGYGLLFVPETYDFEKTKPAKVWAVFINNANKTIIDAEKFTIDTYGDWAEAIRLGVRQSAGYLQKAK